MIYRNMLTRFAVLAICIFTIGIAANAQSSKTKSLIKEIQAEFPERQKMIAEKCGGASVVVDVDFASFGDNYDALLRVPQMGLKETANAFRRFCTDSNDTSKEDSEKVGAVKSKVKKILIKYVAKPEDKKISLQSGGVVLVEMAFDTISGGINYVAFATKLGDIL